MKKLILSLFCASFLFGLYAADKQEQEIDLDGQKIRCLVAEPSGKSDKKAKPALFVFIGGGPGREMQAKAAFDLAKGFAKKNNLYLLTPISEDDGAFLEGKNSLVIKVIQKLIADGKVSPTTVVIGGMSNGGVASLQIAGSGEVPVKGVVAVPGVVTQNMTKKDGWMKTPVYLRIGEQDELGWAKGLEPSKNVLANAGAITDAALVKGGPHIFPIAWDEVEKWMKDNKVMEEPAQAKK
ncbi:MAG: alpha/beta hydrolase family protein [Planctomycetota bacterium]